MSQIQATLHLSEGFGQCGVTIPFETSKFPAGEVYIKVDVPLGTQSVRINSRCGSSDELMQILMAADALGRNGVKHVELFLPYFPYSRQDRACNKGEAFSLKVACLMLIQAVDKIITYDVHSNVTLSLLDRRIKNYNNNREVLEFLDYCNPNGNENLALICPDAGSAKRLKKLYDDTGIFKTIVYCTKNRVGGMVIINPIENNIMGMTAIVIDDICDGGATFVELGARLLERHVKKSHLFVSHGIFSKGIDALRMAYRCIGTTNSMAHAGIMPLGVKTFNLDY